MWWRCFWMVLSVQPRKGMNWSCFQAASMLQVAFFGERTTMDHSDHSCLRLLEATHVLDFQRPSLNDWSHEYYQCALCTSIMQQHVILMPSIFRNFAGNARITWIFFLVPTGTSKHRDCQPMLHPKRSRFSPIEVDVFAVCLSWKLLKHPSFAWLFYSILTFGMVHWYTSLIFFEFVTVVTTCHLSSDHIAVCPGMPYLQPRRPSKVIAFCLRR